MERDIHAVLVPFVAFGHLMPFYQLSVALAKSGVHVSFVSTPNNIHRLPELPPSLSPLINFVALPLPAGSSNLLPEGAEATIDVPGDKVQHLMAAFDLLKQPFKQFVAEQSPDWIVTDLFNWWTVDVAQECHVRLAIFSVFSAASLVFFGPPEYLAGDGLKRVRSSLEDLTSPPWWVSFPSSVAYRYHEAVGAFPGIFKVDASGISISERFAKALHGCEAVGIRSCREFESEYLDLFGKIMGSKPVIPAGVLPPEQQPNKTRIAAGGGETWTEIFKWLDEQRPKSVVFVGFGSECNKLTTRDQFYEIAYGLEASELPFLWTLHKPSWAADDLNALPPDFGRRTSGRGRVCIGWAPQIEILGHPSIGGSLFHGGWGSMIETLQFGHCMAVLPFMLDQPLNARLLVEKGLAIEVERSEEDGSFGRDEIARCLRKAMASEERDEMRTRVKKAAAIFGDRKLHDMYVTEFVDHLK